VCLAYKSEGGRIIAVLSSRPKPDMEQLLKEALPIDARSGSAIVVRQGAGLSGSLRPDAASCRRAPDPSRRGRGERRITRHPSPCLPRRMRLRVRCQGRGPAKADRGCVTACMMRVQHAGVCDVHDTAK